MLSATPPSSRKFVRAWFTLAGFAMAVFLLLAFVLWSAYLEAAADGERKANNYADLLEARLDATLRRLDSDTRHIAADIRDLSPEAMNPARVGQYRRDVERDLAAFHAAFPEVAGFRLIDARGKVLYMAGQGQYIDVSDREYFVRLRDSATDELIFSNVMVSRINGRPVLVGARAVRDTEGRFLGIVSVPLELNYFQDLFKSVRLDPDSFVSVRRQDNHGVILSHPPQERDAAGADEMVPPQQAGVWRGANENGTERIYAVRTLSNFPFYIVAGLSVEEVMSSWRNRVIMVGGISVLLMFGAALLLYQLYRAEQEGARARHRILHQQQQLREAHRIARVGTWEMDLVKRRFTGSEELYRLYEVDQDALVDGYGVFLDSIHPEDRPAVETAYREALGARQPFQIEHRAVMPDGRIKHLLEFAETQYDEHGQPLRTIGTVQDITGARQMEAKMQLLASAFHYSGEAIFITDAANKVVTVNPAFSALTGYTAEDAVGRDPGFLSAGRNDKVDYGQIWQAVGERGFWQGEVWDRRKDGSVFPKWMSVSGIRDDQGVIRHYVSHFSDVSVERAVEAQLEHIAHHDVLTGLLNRLSLRGRLDQALASARRSSGSIALLFIDLDRFKVINDTLGHHVGDEMLIEVARRLQESVRESDVVARLGGDEFVIMLTGIDGSNAVATVAEKIVFSIGDPYRIEGHDLYTSPSIGIAMYPSDGEDGETLMKNADAAMYHAKAAGRNNFQFFDSKMNDAVLERLNIENALRQALAQEQFLLHFQPILDLRTGRVVSVEALVRWLHPEQGLVSPARFIPVAEETGLIQPLGDWVFWTACRHLAEFNQAGIHGVKMSINISAMQMRNDSLPVIARGALDVYNLDPGEMVFEITESVAMNRPEDTIRILNNLHDMGIGLAIDDFGTGYSSLAYLKMFPIDNLKLDRAFVEEIGTEPGGATICDATISLAHSMGLRLVAEGVETESQLAYLRGKGCDMVQGYYFSRPVAFDEVVAFIRLRNGIAA